MSLHDPEKVLDNDKHDDEKCPATSSASSTTMPDTAAYDFSNEKGKVVAPADDWNPTWDDARSWLIVLGCFIFSAVTAGWGYVLDSTSGTMSATSSQCRLYLDTRSI